MPVVQMHIDKFGRVVSIDSEHPLAVAQRAKDAENLAIAEQKTDAMAARLGADIKPTVPVEDDAPAATPASAGTRRASARSARTR